VPPLSLALRGWNLLHKLPWLVPALAVDVSLAKNKIGDSPELDAFRLFSAALIIFLVAMTALIGAYSVNPVRHYADSRNGGLVFSHVIEPIGIFWSWGGLIDLEGKRCVVMPRVPRKLIVNAAGQIDDVLVGGQVSQGVFQGIVNVRLANQYRDRDVIHGLIWE
jgi:hypothetical protein